MLVQYKVDISHRHQTLCQYEYNISNGQIIVSNIYILNIIFCPLYWTLFSAHCLCYIHIDTTYSACGWCPLCTRPTCLIGFLQCQLTETTVNGQTCCSTQTHYPDSEPIKSLLFLLNAKFLVGKKQIFYNLWVVLTGARIHNLRHSRRAR